jgi:hypothetical protein
MVESSSARTLFQRVLIFTAMLAASVPAAEICNMTFTGCPQTFNGDTIMVPQNVVKISSLVHACNASQTIQVGGGGGTCSIVFVIDNTGSMKGANGNDPTGARFTVTKALLDTLFAHAPQTEVGLVVFREHLFFDTTTTEYYTKYFKALHPTLDNQPDQAYLPFMTLNQTYDGKLGINIIKDILAQDTANDDLVYQPNWAAPTGGQTNINGAFIGVKQAFQSAKNPKDDQYVIFMSDGDPEGAAQANLDPHWFDTPAGTANMPTTFTVFFIAGGGAAPADLVTMTNNIKNNGYSTSNPNSNIWSLATVNYTTLMNLLMNNVITNLLLSGNPTKMVLNNITSTIYIDSSFFFTDSFPIANVPTPFAMNITYRYVNPTTNILQDTVVAVHFYVQQTSQTTLPAGVDEICTGSTVGIPVTATLLDTNHNGHIDRIDITWTDTSTINQVMPTVAQFIQTLQITTLDGQKVTLTAVSIQPDLANKTIHIILSENTGNVYETAWQPNPSITLTNWPMSTSGSPFVVTAVVNGTRPVIKSACFVPTPGADTLHVVYSSPIAGLNPAIDPNNAFLLYTSSGQYPFAANNPPASVHADMLVYIFPGNTLSGLDSIVEGTRPAFHLSTCGNVSIVVKSIATVNPFIPGKSIIPPSQRNPNGGPASGTRIEVLLIPAIVGDLQSGKVTGTVSIFDAVGNVVMNRIQMFPDITAVKVFWVWDGKTRTGSWAAPGTYLARITISDQAQNTTQNIRLNIGIKH